MATSEHKATGKKNLFCCVRGQPCKCPSPNNYRTICKPGWGNDPKGKAVGYAAHHILCVASVKACVVKKRGLAPIVKKTRWCVNARGNMVALPLWGQTISWYHRHRPLRPPFANKTQHDYDHNGSASYREEVEDSLDTLAQNVADAQDKHDDARIKQLKAGLNARSRSFRSKLKGRGKRKGGTHKQFDDKKRAGRWWEPFSMSNHASEKGYPRQDWRKSITEKVKRFFG